MVTENAVYHLSPVEAERLGGICPVCGKKLTMGVDHRILQLSDRDESSAAMPESGRHMKA